MCDKNKILQKKTVTTKLYFFYLFFKQYFGVNKKYSQNWVLHIHICMNNI